MSRVDSGLGWSCDSAYFVKDARTYLGRAKNHYFYKEYNGPAIIVFQRHSNGWTGPVLVSTVQSYCETNQTSQYVDSATIDGVMWYRNDGGHEQWGDYDPNGWQVFEWLSTRDILIKAGVIFGSAATQSIPVQFQNLEDSFDISVYPTT